MDAFGGQPLLHVAGKYPLIRSVAGPVRNPALSVTPEQFVADHLIVSVRAGLPANEVQALATRHRATVLSRLGALDIYILGIAPEHLDTLQAGLRAEPAVIAADYDRIVSIITTPSDPQFPAQWGLMQQPPVSAGINAPAAWDICHDAPDVIVAVVDTGIDRTHPDLVANLWRNSIESASNGLDDDGNGYVDDIAGWNFCAGTPVPQDDNFHGTHVAGIIGAEGDNGVGITGVCWRVRIMPVKCLDQNGSGYLSDCILALDYASANGAKIINCSWGFSGTDSQVAAAIERCRIRGSLVVAAAGNNGTNNDVSPFYPAACANPGLIAVAALDRFGTLASFSNYGSGSVGIAAPGADIFSTLPVDATAAMTASSFASSYGFASGTSMAAPFVSGAAALLAEVAPTLGPEALADRLRERSSIVPALLGQLNGGRRLDLRAVIDPAWVPSQAAVALDDAWFPEVVGGSNGDGFLAAGESAWIQLRLGNHGQTAANGVMLSLSCDPDLATISRVSQGPVSLQPGSRAVVEQQFQIHFAPNVTPMSTVTLAVTATWAGGNNTSQRDIFLLSPTVIRSTHSRLPSSPVAVIGWGGIAGGGIEKFDLTEVDRIYAVPFAYIAQRADGSLASWGEKSFTGVWNPLEFGRVVKVAVDSTIAVALRDDGTLLSLAYPTVIPNGLTDVTDVAVGIFHGLALNRAGEIVAWGDNSQGQCDVPPDLGPVKAVRAHWFSSLAILTDGSLRTWGGTISTSPLGVNDIVDAGLMATDTVLTLRADGRLLSWGGYSTTVQAKLEEWGIARASRIAVSGGRFAVMDLAGNVYNYSISTGDSIALPPITQSITDLSVSQGNIGLVLSDGSVICAGDDSSGQLRIPRHSPGDVVQIAGGGGGGYLLHAAGTVSEFGFGSSNALADSDALSGVESIAARYGPAFALSHGGLTGFGVVFSNTDAGRTVPVGLSAVVQPAAGYHGHLALRNDGTVIGWGKTPLPPAELRFRQVAASHAFGLGITNQGQAVMWNEGGSSVLSDRAVRIACGFSQLLVLRDDGTVLCQGTQPPEPLSDVVDIACGQSFCMALTTSGRVVLWSNYSEASLAVPAAVASAQAIIAGDGSAYVVLPAKAAAGISIADAVVPYDGRPHLPYAITTPPGLIVQHLVDGESTLPVRPGRYAIQGSIDSWGYSGQASGNLTIHGVSIDLTSMAPPYVTGPSQIDVRCSEAVDDLPATALAIRNCTIASITGSGSQWQIQAVPMTSLMVSGGSVVTAVPTQGGSHWLYVIEAPVGKVSVRLGEGAARDMAGNPSEASAMLILPGVAPADVSDDGSDGGGVCGVSGIGVLFLGGILALLRNCMSLRK